MNFTRKFQILKAFPSKHVFVHGNINKAQYYYMGHKSRAAWNENIWPLGSSCFPARVSHLTFSFRTQSNAIER